jgi:choline/glycine/proline betaine transport protein
LKWSAFAFLSLLAVGLLSGYSFESAGDLLIEIKDGIVFYFDWLFVWVASGSLVLVAVLGVLPQANLRLGTKDEAPEFSRFSWFAMLFSAGLASGLLYWAVAEPIIHYQSNPFMDGDGARIGGVNAAAAQVALRITVFHWGLHGWGLYILGGLAISIASYRHNRPLTIRSALYPILGDRWIDRWPGRAVDGIALLGTVFGVATSIGLSAAALNATLASGFGLTVNSTTQIVIVFVVCGFGVISAISGVGRGIRRLSEINVWVSSVFLVAIFLLGPTAELLALVGTTTLDYVVTVLPTGLWLGATETETAWQGEWTVFYWGWWLAWMPFVSLFIARISKGRTLREFVVAILCVPTLVIVVWMAILGGTALHQEQDRPGAVSVAVNQDYSLGIVTVLENLPMPGVAMPLIAVAAFLLFSWLITSLDSATLVISHLVGAPNSARQQAFWGLILAVVTAVLIAVGGVPALQAASIIVGLPLAGITVLIGIGLVKDLVTHRL